MKNGNFIRATNIDALQVTDIHAYHPNAPLKKTSLVVLNKIVSYLLLDAQLKLSQEPNLFTGATFFQEKTQFSFPSLKTPTASDLKNCRTSLSMKGKCTTQHSPN